MPKKRPKRRPPAAEPPKPYDAAAEMAETERLRYELADRILRLRCSNPRRCVSGACRRTQLCQRHVERDRALARPSPPPRSGRDN